MASNVSESHQPDTDVEPEDVKVSMLIEQFKTKALQKALKQGCRDVRVLSQLIKKAPGSKVNSALALHIKDPIAIDALIKSGADVNKVPDLLTYAANEGADDTIEVLLNAGVEPTGKALHAAILENHLDIVQMLVQMKVQISDALWKRVLTESRDKKDLRLLSLLLPIAGDTRLLELLSKSLDTLDTKMVLMILRTVSAQRMDITSNLFKLFCLNTHATDEAYRLIWSQLQWSMTENDKQEVLEKGHPAIVKILKRYK